MTNTHNYSRHSPNTLTLVAVIGFLNTNPTIFEGEGALNFTIGILQGYLDTFVAILFMTEASSAKGTCVCVARIMLTIC